MASKLPLSQTVMAAVRVRMSSMGMSGNELAKRAGLSQPTVARWLRDQGAPGLNDLEKIAEALATTPEKLMKGVTR